MVIEENMKKFKKHLNDPLFKNAYVPMMGTAVTSASGLIFWIIVTHIYEISAVGLASAIISVISILAIFSDLGLGIGLIRFLPSAKEHGNSMINTSFTIGSITSLITATIFLLGINLWSPALIPIFQNQIFVFSLIIFTIFGTLNPLILNIFLTKQSTRFTFIQNITSSFIKFPLIILFISLGAFGIFASIGISTMIAILLSIFYYLPKIQNGYFPYPELKKDVLMKIGHYSAGNYIARVFLESLPFILPIIVLNTLGAEISAYFYMAWSITTILMVIPNSIFNSLFAMSSNKEETHHTNVKRSIKLLVYILIPIIILILLLADKILLFFGKSYSENGAMLLRILSISVFFYSINFLYITITRVKMQVKSVIKMTFIMNLLTLILCYFLIIKYGLIGVGYGYFFGQTIVAIPIIIYLIHKY